MCGRRGGDRSEPPEPLHIAADNGAEPESAAAAQKKLKLMLQKGNVGFTIRHAMLSIALGARTSAFIQAFIAVREMLRSSVGASEINQMPSNSFKELRRSGT
jgi:hypothetical protein